MSDPQLRLVVYPALFWGKITNRYGYFLVTFVHGKPTTAKRQHLDGIESLEAASDLLEAVLEAFRLESLYCLNTVNCELEEEWDGTLHF
jgi:hypothetical protein